MRAPRFVALGDSLTEGVGDPAGNGWRGWAALLAGALAEADVELTNLAVSGAQTGRPWRSGRRSVSPVA
ncbi:GDSL-type esterase/lipase family protein [Streptomyces sp. SLBN-31]|uniref:GDSL-type esterase/lipase family protein n=1 Tax=Streptomyces sp. SLBN-31 TaxID=2768444 RepID=UPI0037D9F941